MQKADIVALTRELERLYWRGDVDTTLRRVEETWPLVASLEDDADAGQFCRLAMLAHFQRQDYVEGDVWKARALSRFVRAPSGRGVAAILMSLALRAIALGNGRGANLPLAIHLLELMEPLNHAPGQPEVATLSFEDVELHRVEKLGYVLSRVGRFAEARKWYAAALQYTEDERAVWRARGGLALATWLDDPSAPEARHSEEELQAIVDASVGRDDLASMGRIAGSVLERIRTGGARSIDDFAEHFDIR